MVWALHLTGIAFLIGVVVTFLMCVPLVQPALRNKMFDTLVWRPPAAIVKLRNEYFDGSAEEEKRRAIYLQEIPWDNAFAISYAGSLLSWWAAEAVAWGGDWAPSSLNWFTAGMAMSLLAGCSDLIENQLVATILLRRGPLKGTALVYALSAATHLKVCAGGAAILGLIALFVAHGPMTGAH